MRPARTLVKTRQASKSKGIDMAGNGDMKAHEQTYDLVMSIFKWGTVACALVGALVIVLIST